jgi:hypothetical protein
LAKELEEKKTLFENEKRRLTLENRQLRTDKSTLSYARAAAEGLRASLQDTVNVLEQDRLLQSREIAELREQATILRNRLAEANEETERLERGIRALQKEGFKRAQGADKSALDDSRIRQKLKADLTTSVIDWVKKFALVRMTNPDEKTQDFIEGGVRAVSSNATGVPMLTAQDITPRALAQAFLSHFIMQNIVKESFHALNIEEFGRKDTGSTVTSKHLLDFYQRFEHIDAPSAMIWRSEKLRAHEAQNPNPLNHPSRQAFFESLLPAVKKSGFFGVLQRTDEIALEGLLHIFEEISNITRELWKQRAMIQVKGAADFCGTPFQWVDPSDATCTVVADRSYKLEDCPFPGRYDGCVINMVVQPAIVAVPVENGKLVQGPPKVWLPAIVKFAVNTE